MKPTPVIVDIAAYSQLLAGRQVIDIQFCYTRANHGEKETRFAGIILLENNTCCTLSAW